MFVGCTLASSCSEDANYFVDGFEDEEEVVRQKILQHSPGMYRIPGPQPGTIWNPFLPRVVKATGAAGLHLGTCPWLADPLQGSGHGLDPRVSDRPRRLGGGARRRGPGAHPLSPWTALENSDPTLYGVPALSLWNTSPIQKAMSQALSL
uniref:Uncharacterized protein n=1 Tax=Eutreptiella gymnastica TaxID=73025 RepID=A0A7S4FZC9_9EUGL